MLPRVASQSGESNTGSVSPAEGLVESLLDERLPFDVDWSTPASLLDEEARFARLARVKALLPADNALEEKSTHDVTLENYIRLALRAAGDRETLGNFLGMVNDTLASQRPGMELLAQQVFWIWGPAAEIAGFYHLKTELEERAFAVLLPDEFARIRDTFETADTESLQNFLMGTRQLIFEAVQEVVPGISFEDVTARRKSYFNIWRKCHNRGEDYTLSDFMGFRVVIAGSVIIDGADEETAVANCYAALGEICGYFEMDPERFKNYIAQPKPNGYRSLHLTLYTEQGQQLELQIRTRTMHEFAESDTQSSHLLYDAAYKMVPGKEFRSYRKIPRLYVWRKEVARRLQENPDSTELFDGGELLFFRPDGNLYKIEEGATALDGAFRIHDKRALRSEAVSINGRQASFSDRLRHGDLVDIEYRDSYPTDLMQVERLRDNIATEPAHKAISRARRALLRDDLIARGRQIICAKVGNVGLSDPLSALDDKDRRYLANRSGQASFEDMLFLAGMGNRAGKPGRIANLIKARMGLGELARIKLSPEPLRTIEDVELLALIHIPNEGGAPECRVAGCCSQKIERGDTVVARPIRSEGMMSLHRSDCVNVRHYPGLINCSWNLLP